MGRAVTEEAATSHHVRHDHDHMTTTYYTCFTCFSCMHHLGAISSRAIVCCLLFGIWVANVAGGGGGSYLTMHHYSLIITLTINYTSS